MVERIDELTGLPTTRTGVVPRKEGELGPGAESGMVLHEGLGVICGYLVREPCRCGGTWELWGDDGRGMLIFRHLASMAGKVYARAFDEFRYPGLRNTDETIRYLTRHEVHPENAPTPGRARR